MTTITFREVRCSARRRGLCPVCGRSTTRTKTFTQTVSPWNRHPDGQVKTGQEVFESVRAEADAWIADHAHARCATTTESEAP